VTVEASFDSSLDSVALARRFAADALDGVSLPVASDVVLLVSELATNAILHAATRFDLCIERSDEAIRVEVIDGGAGQARRQSPSPSDLHGRGLQLVESLSDDWGTRQDGSTKAVWFVRNLAVGDSGRHRQEGSARRRLGRTPKGVRGTSSFSSSRRPAELLAAPMAI
jgi:anti-sigma regulatory factor (Ser/Thr protein kinase)